MALTQILYPFVFALLLIVTQHATAQSYSRDSAIRIAAKLRQTNVLSEAGERSLLERIDWTERALTPISEGLWWARAGGRHADTNVVLSRASMLNFLVCTFAAVFEYRTAMKEERDLMTELGIIGVFPPDPEHDSLGYIQHMQKIDSVLHLKHEGKAIEARIRREDPLPPGFHFFVASFDTAGVLSTYPVGSLAPTMSVTGKTRSALIMKLHAAGLIDAGTSRKLLQRVRRNHLMQEINILIEALAQATAHEQKYKALERGKTRR